MSKKQVRYVSYTNLQKKEFIHNLGYTIVNYDGKFNDLPRAIRADYKPLQPGFYLVQNGTQKPLRHLVFNYNGRYEEIQRKSIDAGFEAALAREIAYRLDGIYVRVDNGNVETQDYRSKEDVPYHDGYLNDVANYVANQRPRNGFYFYADTGHLSMGYNDFLIMLYDAMMEGDYEDLYCYGSVTGSGQPKPANETVHNSVSKKKDNNRGYTVQRTGAFEFVLQNGRVVGMFFEPGAFNQLLAY